SFKWGNLATNNAGVTVVIVGLAPSPLTKPCRLYEDARVHVCAAIGCYLLPNQTAIIQPRERPLSPLPLMVFGNKPSDGGHLILNDADRSHIEATAPEFVYRYVGAQELIDGVPRHCLWIRDDRYADAAGHALIAGRLERVRAARSASTAADTRKYAAEPHRFVRR